MGVMQRALAHFAQAFASALMSRCNRRFRTWLGLVVVPARLLCSLPAHVTIHGCARRCALHAGRNRASPEAMSRYRGCGDVEFGKRRLRQLVEEQEPPALGW